MQQHLVGLAVNLQLACALMDSDPAAATAILDEMRRDVRQALDDTAQLGERIYPPLLEIGGLAAVLRSAALSAGVPASVEVAGDSSHSPQIARTVYFCWLDVLEHAEGEARVSATVREEEGALSFEFVARRESSVQTVGRSETMLERLRDRVETLGGRLAVEADSARGTRVYGSLPLGP